MPKRSMDTTKVTRPTVLWIATSVFATDPLGSRLTAPKRQSKVFDSAGAAEEFAASKRKSGALVWIATPRDAQPEPEQLDAGANWPRVVCDSRPGAAAIGLRYLPEPTPPPTKGAGKMAARLSDYSTAAYLSPQNLDGDYRVAVKIVEVTEAPPFREEQKPRPALVLSNVETGEMLPKLALNVTQRNAVASLFGDLIAGLIGKTFVLTVGSTTFQGRSVKTFVIAKHVELRDITTERKRAASLSRRGPDDLDDAIPF